MDMEGPHELLDDFDPQSDIGSTVEQGSCGNCRGSSSLFVEHPSSGAGTDHGLSCLCTGALWNLVDCGCADMDLLSVQQDEDGEWMLVLRTGQDQSRSPMDVVGGTDSCTWEGDGCVTSLTGPYEMGSPPSVPWTLGDDTLSSAVSLPSTVGDDPWFLDDLFDLEPLGIEPDDSDGWTLTIEVELQDRKSTSSSLPRGSEETPGNHRRPWLSGVPCLLPY